MTVAIVDMDSAGAGLAFVDTLTQTGFAVLRNAPLSAGRMRRMAAAWRAFFESEAKWDYLAETVASGNASGYVPPEVSETAVGHTQRDLKEFFHIMPGTRMPEDLRADSDAHLVETFRLGQRLLDWVDLHCGALLPPALRGHLADSLSRSDSLLRMLHYPPLSGDEPAGAVRAAAHEDINLLTLLPVSAEPGLQILGRDLRWHDVPGEPGDVIINSGDMLQEATGGRLPSTSHRVVNPESAAANVSRVAMPCFLAPQLDVRLSDRHTAGSYLRERLAQLAR